MKVNVKDFFKRQQCSKSSLFYPSLKKMIENNDEASYKKYLKWRKFKNIDKRIEEARVLILKMRNKEYVDPIVVDGDVMVDGNHRLIIAEVLGWETIEAIPGELKKKNEARINSIRGACYQKIHRQKNYPKWRGVDILKFPTDLFLYAEVIQETRPEIIIEIGTKYGGSAVYFQDLLDLNKDGGRIITVDVNPQVVKKDDRITYLIGSSTNKDIIDKIKESVQNKKVMVILDGDHSENQVYKEMYIYRSIVSKGMYMVSEDCYVKEGVPFGPLRARDRYLAENDDFIQTNLCRRFFCGMNLGGWLRKK